MESRLLTLLRSLDLSVDQIKAILDAAEKHFTPGDNGRLDQTLGTVRAEYLRATRKFGAFASTHEGYGILKEEFDEMWDEIKANKADRACEESVQVAAMAVRFIVDLG